MFKGIPSDSKVYEILKMFKGTTELFVDYGFPNELVTITSNEKHKKYNEFKNCDWVRSHELFGCTPSEVVLYDGIDPNDIS